MRLTKLEEHTAADNHPSAPCPGASVNSTSFPPGATPVARCDTGSLLWSGRASVTGGEVLRGEAEAGVGPERTPPLFPPWVPKSPGVDRPERGQGGLTVTGGGSVRTLGDTGGTHLPLDLSSDENADRLKALEEMLLTKLEDHSVATIPLNIDASRTPAGDNCLVAAMIEVVGSRVGTLEVELATANQTITANAETVNLQIEKMNSAAADRNTFTDEVLLTKLE